MNTTHDKGCVFRQYLQYARPTAEPTNHRDKCGFHQYDLTWRRQRPETRPEELKEKHQPRMDWIGVNDIHTDSTYSNILHHQLHVSRAREETVYANIQAAACCAEAAVCNVRAELATSNDSLNGLRLNHTGTIPGPDRARVKQGSHHPNRSLKSRSGRR